MDTEVEDSLATKIRASISTMTRHAGNLQASSLHPSRVDAFRTSAKNVEDQLVSKTKEDFDIISHLRHAKRASLLLRKKVELAKATSERATGLKSALLADVHSILEVKNPKDESTSILVPSSCRRDTKGRESYAEYTEASFDDDAQAEIENLQTLLTRERCQTCALEKMINDMSHERARSQEEWRIEREMLRETIEKLQGDFELLSDAVTIGEDNEEHLRGEIARLQRDVECLQR